MPPGLEHRLGPSEEDQGWKNSPHHPKWMKTSMKNVKPELPRKQKISTDSGIWWNLAWDDIEINKWRKNNRQGNMKRKMKGLKSKQKTTPHKGTRKEKRKDQSPYTRLHLARDKETKMKGSKSKQKTTSGKDQSWNKRSHWAREQEKKKERTEVETKDHTWKCRTHNGEP